MDTFDAWFQENNLTSFKQLFLDNGYDELEVVSTITDSELREMGVNLPGHHKKILIKTMSLGKKMKLEGDMASVGRDKNQYPKTQAGLLLVFVTNNLAMLRTDAYMIIRSILFEANANEISHLVIAYPASSWFLSQTFGVEETNCSQGSHRGKITPSLLRI